MQMHRFEEQSSKILALHVAQFSRVTVLWVRTTPTIQAMIVVNIESVLFTGISLKGTIMVLLMVARQACVSPQVEASSRYYCDTVLLE